MFAALVIERAPLQWSDALPILVQWVQLWGGIAMLGLILWLALGLPRLRPDERARIPGWLRVAFGTATVAAFVFYLVALLLFSLDLRGGSETSGGGRAMTLLRTLQQWGWTLGGACAIVAVGLPFARNLPRQRFRRIFALAKLSFKEAIRRRVLYAFTGFLLVLLFASWFMLESKPEDQVRTYVSLVSLVTTVLLLVTSVLMASFSIPADIRQQTIHTVVTKPVERFEVVLGRFLGFLALMTVVLLIMTGISLIYVIRGVNPEAAEESLKARVWVNGDLSFENTGDPRKAVNVGREWDYRSYITMAQPGQDPQVARFDFADLPSGMTGRKRVRCEFTFDIYRTTKGKENEGVPCTFEFRTWRFRPEYLNQIDTKVGTQEEENEKARKYGYFSTVKQVVDYHTQFIDLPGGLFDNALGEDKERSEELARSGVKPPPRLEVRIKFARPTPQYVGMASHDLYLRLDEPGSNEMGRFALNFFKGAFGLWLQLALVIGLATVLSTYLNGVISALCTGILFVAGLSKDFIHEVALGKNVGGGPMEAALKLIRRELVGPSPDQSGTTAERIVAAWDESFRWTLRLILHVFPDLHRFDLTNYVAEGFNIGSSETVLTFLLVLVPYLLPWFVLGYYLITWREVASSS
jgi:hypothetical protein